MAQIREAVHIREDGVSSPLSLAQLVGGGDPPRGADPPHALPPRLLGPFWDKCIFRKSCGEMQAAPFTFPGRLSQLFRGLGFNIGNSSIIVD
jgi:hypothetical protein